MARWQSSAGDSTPTTPLTFGTSLTQMAKLPEGAERALTDPYAEKERPWKTYGVIAFLIFVALAWWTSR